MTTLNLEGVSVEQRRTLLNAHLARVSSRHLDTRIGTALRSLMAGLSGSEDTPEVDLSGLDRRRLSSVVRLVESVAAITPNADPLKRFAADIEAADRAANPDALPLRTL